MHEDDHGRIDRTEALRALPDTVWQRAAAIGLEPFMH